MNEEQTSGMYGQKLSFGHLFSWPVAMIKSPGSFFGNLQKSGGFGTPIVFALFWIFVSTIIEAVVGRIRPVQLPYGTAVEVAWIFLGPLFLLAMGLILAGVFFVIWHLMGSKENYEAAFRCWAFTTPVAVAGAILGIVPMLNLLAFLYGTYLLVAATVHLHKVSKTRAWAVWGSLCALMVILVVLAAVGRIVMKRAGLTPAAAGQQFGQTPDMQEMTAKIQQQMQELNQKAEEAAGKK